jgi:multidrug resistance efflux pump
MNLSLENKDAEGFAIAKEHRDSRASRAELHERTASSDPLEALRRDSDEVLERRIEFPEGLGRKSGASGANLAAALATNNKAQLDVRRYRELLDQGVILGETNDQIVMTGKVDAAAVNSARAAEAAAARETGEAEAAVQAAQAALDHARLNLSYTKIYAPANGIVGRRTLELGSRIEPGQTLMFVTETDEIWVTADFKETQLARMHRGERVSVHVDTFGRDYRGYVRNLPGPSGDRFSLLPAENATGNYVKVVQRLPVRIEFDPGQDPDHLLHPGMSVEPKVWLR